MRTASSAVRPLGIRRRISLDRLRIVFYDGGHSMANPSAIERRAASIEVPLVCPDVAWDGAFFRTHGEPQLAAMRPVSSGPAGAVQKGGGTGVACVPHKEFSCPKNWLSPRPPTNGGSRFWKKAS